jgi:transposase
MTPEKKRRSRRKYTQDFKDDAVRLILEGTPVKEAAEKLGVERSCLGRWRDQYLERLERSGAGSDLAMSPKEMAAEIATLRKQLKRSELHREILKKAVTIFSQDPRNALSS